MSFGGGLGLGGGRAEVGGCGALDEDFGGGGEFGVTADAVEVVAAVGLGDGWS